MPSAALRSPRRGVEDDSSSDTAIETDNRGDDRSIPWATKQPSLPALKAAAPTQSEPPFAIAEGVALVVFIGLGIAAARLFRNRGEVPLRA